MSDIKKIRELTGLSQKGIANLLGVSRATIYMVEKGKRSLSKETIFKLAAIQEHLKQAPVVVPETGKVVFSDPLKHAQLHRGKMEKHNKLARACQRQLEKMQQAAPFLQNRWGLFSLVKNHPASDRGDELLIELLELTTKKPAKLLEELEELQDKIDTHLAYAALHKQRWQSFLEMA